jgi:hypothetical protein
MTLRHVDFQAIERRARRERAEAVNRLLVRPLLGLFRRAPRSHLGAAHGRAAA